MSRIMLDAASPANIPRAIRAQLVMGYDTGSPGQWWNGHWGDFPGMTMVHVDQAGSGAPSHSANVIDIEPGCYPAQDVAQWRRLLNECTAPRPTAYCDQSDYADFVRPNWRGDVLLAAPGVTVAPDPQVIGIQNVFATNYDQSIVFDDNWPGKAVVTHSEAEMINGVIDPNGQRDIPFPAGSFHEVCLFHDFNRSPLVVRVAVCSKANGFSQINEVTIPGNHPVTLTFTATDANAVSLENRSTAPIGYTVA